MFVDDILSTLLSDKAARNTSNVASHLVCQWFKYSPKEFARQMQLLLWGHPEIGPSIRQAVVFPAALIVIRQQLTPSDNRQRCKICFMGVKSERFTRNMQQSGKSTKVNQTESAFDV